MSTLTPRVYAQLAVDGYSNSEIAELCSVTPGYVTQVAAQEDTQLYLAKAREEAGTSSVATQLDSGYDALELKLLKQLESVSKFLTKPSELARVLQTVNNAKRRRGPLNPTTTSAPVVQLVVPIAIQNKITLSENSEVLEIAGRRMQTMPAANLTALVEKRHEAAKLVAPEASTGNPVLDAIG